MTSSYLQNGTLTLEMFSTNTQRLARFILWSNSKVTPLYNLFRFLLASAVIQRVELDPTTSTITILILAPTSTKAPVRLSSMMRRLWERLLGGALIWQCSTEPTWYAVGLTTPMTGIGGKSRAQDTTQPSTKTSALPTTRNSERGTLVTHQDNYHSIFAPSAITSALGATKHSTSPAKPVTS